MIRNYLKIAWRNTLNNRVYSGLNILGLASGMAVALLIGLWVQYEYSFDKFLPGYQQLYQVRRNFNSNGDTLTFGSTSLKLANALRNNIPEIEHVAETDWTAPHGLVVGDKKLSPNGLQAGGDFLKMFRYPMLLGNADDALKDPYSIVLSEKIAKALFGNANPLNKIIRVDNHNNLKVTGVMKDLPTNSSLKYTNFIIPFSYLEETQNWVKQARAGSFGDNAFQLFAELKPGISYAQVAPKIKNIEKVEKDNVNAMNSNVIMQPMQDWHLYGDYKNGKATNGFIQYVRIFSIIGALVLIIACINFINLSTARSEKRAREVGVRKAIGSSRKDLVFQFLTESTLVTFISFLFALLIVQLVLPAFNSLTGTLINVPYTSIGFCLVTLCCVLLTALLAGARPAFYLSSFNPVKVLKGSIQIGRSAALSRKILIVTQFICSIALIISTVIIYRQIQYAKDRPVGYQVSQLLTTTMNDDLIANQRVLKNKLLQSGFIESVTSASSPATEVQGHMDLDYWPGKNAGETVEMGVITATNDYFKTLGMQMKAGRVFSNVGSDTGNAVLNEAAIKRLRLKEPLNQIIKKNGKQFRIIGIVKDALMNSPFANPDPTMFEYGSGNYLMYRLSPNVKTHEAIETLTAIFTKYSPSYPFQYSFVDEEYSQKFSEEVLVGKLSGIFAVLAIFISCLGLFGLAAYVAEQRTKEIGIRKVLGASVTQVWVLLSRDFIVLVAISCVIASPIARYFLQNWLQKYDYHIKIGAGVFVASAFAAIAITLITVSFQAIKAALANPVKSLKAE
ncbi:MAG: ABC transporter permease [Mucilaginibacter sp.]